MGYLVHQTFLEEGEEGGVEEAKILHSFIHGWVGGWVGEWMKSWLGGCVGGWVGYLVHQTLLEEGEEGGIEEAKILPDCHPCETRHSLQPTQVVVGGWVGGWRRRVQEGGGQGGFQVEEGEEEEGGVGG